MTSGCVQQVADFFTIHELLDAAEARNFECTVTGRLVATEGRQEFKMPTARRRCAAIDGDKGSKADNVIDQMELATI